MVLSQYDLDKIPRDMTLKDCYERIYQWHKKYGKQKIKDKNADTEYKNAYLKFFK